MLFYSTKTDLWSSHEALREFEGILYCQQLDSVKCLHPNSLLPWWPYWPKPRGLMMHEAPKALRLNEWTSLQCFTHKLYNTIRKWQCIIGLIYLNSTWKIKLYGLIDWPGVQGKRWKSETHSPCPGIGGKTGTLLPTLQHTDVNKIERLQDVTDILSVWGGLRQRLLHQTSAPCVQKQSPTAREGRHWAHKNYKKKPWLLWITYWKLTSRWYKLRTEPISQNHTIAWPNFAAAPRRHSAWAEGKKLKRKLLQERN